MIVDLDARLGALVEVSRASSDFASPTDHVRARCLVAALAIASRHGDAVSIVVDLLVDQLLGLEPVPHGDGCVVALPTMEIA